MELMIELNFKKDKEHKKHIVRNTITAKTIKELMEKKGWKLIRTQFLLNI